METIEGVKEVGFRGGSEETQPSILDGGGAGSAHSKLTVWKVVMLGRPLGIKGRAFHWKEGWPLKGLEQESDLKTPVF